MQEYLSFVSSRFEQDLLDSAVALIFFLTCYCPYLFTFLMV